PGDADLAGGGTLGPEGSDAVLQRVAVAGQRHDRVGQTGVGRARIVSPDAGAGGRGVRVRLGPSALGDAAAGLMGGQIAIHVPEGVVGAAFLGAPGGAAGGVGRQTGVRGIDREGAGADGADPVAPVVELGHSADAIDVDVLVVAQAVARRGDGETPGGRALLDTAPA